MNDTLSDLRHIEEPAKSLEDFEATFDPTLAVDPQSRFYVSRTDYSLRRMVERLKKGANRHQHFFLCGHRGSGKTTELRYLQRKDEFQESYLTVFITIQQFGVEVVDLTHDALMLVIGMELARRAKEAEVDHDFEKELDDWGRQVVKTFLHDEEALAEAGADAKWIAFFKAQLRTRREWKTEQRQILEPKVEDLIGILNRISAALREKTGKQVLVIIDDLEKGESDADRAMHRRLFQDNYDTLTRPRFSIVYVTPIYFRSLPGSRIPQDQLFAFSALRLYQQEHADQTQPPLDTGADGYRVARRFVETRIEDGASVFEEGALDELLLIGGGLFRDTARALREAAAFARYRDGDRITMDDAREVFHYVKKEYQPMIRGGAVEVLTEVLNTPQGWVPGIEPFLQSRAVVEYENHDHWLDLRYPLKAYVRSLAPDG